MRVLAERLGHLRLHVEALDPALSDAKEALGFALLADATLRGLSANLPAATGARRAVPLGKISLP
jgi:anhydro-N-acetylmuramic acid kinase